MQHFSISMRNMFGSFWSNRSLILTLVKREIAGRYRGSILGVFWSFLNPFFMLLVYTFVFSVVFNARWSGGSESKTEFALVLFAGLLVFNLFCECVNRAPGLIISNANYVKKIVFPLEIFPWVILGSAMFNFIVSVSIWLAFYMIFYGLPQLTLIFFPFIVLPLTMVTLGFCWLLASLGVYLRDVGQIVNVFTMVLMYISPIFYPVSALPLSYQPIVFFNPLTFLVEQTRAIMFWGKTPAVGLYLCYLTGSIIFAWLGFAWFQKTRKGFADVL